jgi:hypothetical protein
MTVRLFFICSLSILLFAGCSKSTEPGSGGWTVSGKTYLLGSADPLSGVVVRCAGLSTSSGADGSYRLDGVPEGIQVITAELVNCERYSDTIDVKSDMRRYIYLSLRTTKIRGCVTNAIDGPIAGATVRMQSNGVNTDASGWYELPRMTGVSDTLFVTHTLYMPFRTVVYLDSSEKNVDVSLTRQRVIQVKMTEDTYVDESRPDANFGASSTLLLSTNPSGQSGYQKQIYLKFDLPAILRNEEVRILDASLQLMMSSPTPPISIQTYSVAASWTAASITYNIQPARGSLLGTGIIGSGFMGQYWSVLTTSGISQLVTDWRANRPIYGVVVQGGPSSATPASFYSSELSGGAPRLTIQVQY